MSTVTACFLSSFLVSCLLFSFFSLALSLLLMCNWKSLFLCLCQCALFLLSQTHCAPSTLALFGTCKDMLKFSLKTCLYFFAVTHLSYCSLWSSYIFLMFRFNAEHWQCVFASVMVLHHKEGHNVLFALSTSVSGVLFCGLCFPCQSLSVNEPCWLFLSTWST